MLYELSSKGRSINSSCYRRSGFWLSPMLKEQLLHAHILLLFGCVKCTCAAPADLINGSTRGDHMIAHGLHWVPLRLNLLGGDSPTGMEPQRQYKAGV